MPLDGASDHGVSEALYLRDPDGNGLELLLGSPARAVAEECGRIAADDDRPARPRRPARRRAATGRRCRDAQSPYALMSEQNRGRLRAVRGGLLHLHKVLLDDTRVTYEMDRGRVGSNATLLQLVIGDPWFAWLHSLSELIVRIDQTAEPDSPANDADAAALIDQVEHLLTASETGEGFQRRYYEALQRQPAVVLAHADVRRTIKSMRQGG